MKYATIIILAVIVSLIGFSCVMSSIKDREVYQESIRWRQVKLAQTSYGTPEFFAEAKRLGISDDSVEFHFQPWHELYYWNTVYSLELLVLLIQHWELQPQMPSHRLIQKTISEGPPDFHSLLSARDDLDCYISTNFLEGEKGHQISVIWNKTKNRIIVRDYYNF